MSLYDYWRSKQLATDDVPFHALIMGAMRKADHGNLERLQREWPETWMELQRRYNAPGGVLPEERPVGETCRCGAPNDAHWPDCEPALQRRASP